MPKPAVVVQDTHETLIVEAEMGLRAMLDKQKQAQPLDPSTSSNPNEAPVPALSERQLAYKNMLEECIARGMMKSTEPLGQRFQRAIGNDKDLKKEFAANRTYEGMRQYKMQWARTELETLTVSKTKTESQTVKEAKDGTYLPFRVIVQKQGGDAEAVLAAQRLCQKCVTLGGRYVKENPFTERLEFLHIRGKVEEEFTKEWKLKVKQEGKPNEQTTEPAGQAVVPPGDAGAPPAVSTRKRQKGGAPKALKDAPQTKEPELKDLKDINKKMKKEVDELLSRHEKTKVTFARAMMLINDFADEPGSKYYSFKEFDEFKAALTLKSELIKFRASHAFWHEWLVLDKVGLKNKYDDALIKASLASVASLDALLTRFIAVANTLRAMDECRAGA